MVFLLFSLSVFIVLDCGVACLMVWVGVVMSLDDGSCLALFFRGSTACNLGKIYSLC